MTDKELKKLNSKRLLGMIAERTERANRLQQENERLKGQIADRERHLSQMGELSKAILHSGGSVDEEKKTQVLEYLDMLRNAEGSEESGEAEAEKEEEAPGAITDWPTREQLLAEAKREGGRRRYIWSLKTTIYAIIIVTALAVLVAVMFLPVLQIYGTSMAPSLREGDFVISVKTGNFKTGDMVAFYYNNKVLVKRVMATPGQWVSVEQDGTVFVNNVKLDEPYLIEKAFGECDIEMPYQVPENRIFVMGDNRRDSIDSRSTMIGCIAEEQIVGKIVLRVWPLESFGKL